MIFHDTVARLAKRKPDEKTVNEGESRLLGLPNELIDRISFFLDGPEKAVLAVASPKLYSTLRPSLARMSAWEKLECSRRLRILGYFRRQQLPCFTCFDMHQMSHFFPSELQSPLPQCIAECSMWRCACESVSLSQIQLLLHYGRANDASFRPDDIRQLFEPCEECRGCEGLTCTGILVDGQVSNGSITYCPASVVHEIRFQVPGVDVDEAALRSAIAARCSTFNLPICRDMTLSDRRVLASFQPQTDGNGGLDRNSTVPLTLTACPGKGCGLKFGIACEYVGQGGGPAESDAVVTITIARPLPSFVENISMDPGWTSVSFTDRELITTLPGLRVSCGGKGRQGRKELRALVWNFVMRDGSWEFETRMLRHYWRKRAARKARNRKNGAGVV